MKQLSLLLILLSCQPLIAGDCSTGQCGTTGGYQIAQPRQNSPPRQQNLPPAKQTANLSAVTKIEVVDPNNMSSWGSGTIIDDNGKVALVLTCKHILDDGVRFVAVYARSPRKATILAVSQNHDLCLLKITSPGIKPVQLNLQTLPIGMQVQTEGYPHGGDLRAIRGRVVSYAGDSVFATGESILGMSGGPLFDDKCKMAGVAWCAADGENGSVAGQWVREFLASAGEHYPLRQPVQLPLPLPAEPLELVPVAPDVTPPATAKPPPVLPGPGDDGAEGLRQSIRDKFKINLDITQHEAPAPAEPVGETRQPQISEVKPVSPIDVGSLLLTSILVATGAGSGTVIAAKVGGYLLRRAAKKRRGRKARAAISPDYDLPDKYDPGPDPPMQYLPAEPIVLSPPAPTHQPAQQTDSDRALLACSQERRNLEATIVDLRRQLASRPVTYMHPPQDDGLNRMRRAQADVSAIYPGARQWIAMVEKTYNLILSGEKNGRTH